jgi:hypothetical protein
MNGMMWWNSALWLSWVLPVVAPHPRRRGSIGKNLFSRQGNVNRFDKTDSPSPCKGLSPTLARLGVAALALLLPLAQHHWRRSNRLQNSSSIARLRRSRTSHSRTSEETPSV